MTSWARFCVIWVAIGCQLSPEQVLMNNVASVVIVAHLQAFCTSVSPVGLHRAMLAKDNCNKTEREKNG